MKLVRKILPLTALTIVGTIPVVATSCSNVYEDLLSKPYLPKDINPLDTDEITASEAEGAYYNYFKDKKGLLSADSLWGASLFGRKIITQENPLSKCETFLSHVYSFDITETENLTHRFSYKIKAQLQIRNNTKLDGTGSYVINTYDIYFEFKNIECYMTYSGAFDDNDSQRTGSNPWQVWTICPTKYNPERGRWYKELTGDESIRFEIKAVFKGYSATGAQNYVREVNESAIVDEAHKYVPELNEVYTNMMLLDPYYLSNIKPRLYLDNSQYNYLEPTAEDNVYQWKTNFKFNSKTCSEQHGDTLKFTTLDDTFHVYSPTGSDVSVVEIIDADDGLIPTSTTEKVSPTYKVKFDKKPTTGDTVYFCLHIKHSETGSKPEWEEWFPVSAIVSNV